MVADLGAWKKQPGGNALKARTIGKAIAGGIVLVGILIVLSCGLFRSGSLAERIWAAYRANQAYVALEITYPFDGTLFPPEIVAPTFRWDDRTEADTWLVVIEFQAGEDRLSFLTNQTQWKPSTEPWETIKRQSVAGEATVTLIGVKKSAPQNVLSAAAIKIRTSTDEVGAPLFYREVNLPFIEAVKDPSTIRWRFGDVASPKQPPVVLEGLPVCGNCHSFSADGSVLGMDVDYANDKGSYAIAPVEEEMTLDRSRIITWSDYRRADGENTFGLLSQVSPDGRYVVSTVKDLSVFVPRPDLAYSQLFFPIKGILVVYDREKKTFSALPGADDKRFVQSNPTWSPDGKTIVFARSEAHHLSTLGAEKSVLLTEEQCREFLEEGKLFRYDLYRIPFNNGRGGTPEPIPGASFNGMSNYFAKYSPDGKWIVFCRAKSFMLLQPDSELYIIPAAGGEARRMRCNTSRMNSWHSWSPNGRWLVFSSKLNGPYTQLFLTHVDEEGRSTPPVVLEHLTAADRAANIPEFVNAPPDAIRIIREQFLDAVSFRRAARQFVKSGDFDGAIRQCRESLRLNPNDPKVHLALALVLLKQGILDEAATHFAKALELDPGNETARRCLEVVRKEQECRHRLELDGEDAETRYRLGSLLLQRGNVDEALEHFEEAVRLEPDFLGNIKALARTWMKNGRSDWTAALYGTVLEFNPDDVESLAGLAFVLPACPDEKRRDGDEAVRLATRAAELTNHRNASVLDALAAAYAQAGRFPDAIGTARKAIQLARDTGNERLARQIEQRMRLYLQSKPPSIEADPRRRALNGPGCATGP